MAIKNTIQAGNFILRAKVLAVNDIKSAHTKRIVGDLVDSMRAYDLVGIAAPQIGKSLRIFATEIRNTKLRKSEEIDELRIFINPKIISTSKRLSKGWEGCGSVAEAGLFAIVTRPQSVSIEASDQQGEKFTLKASGLLARVIQHENDHLNGVLFTDIAHMDTVMSRNEYLKFKNKKAQL